MRSRLSLSGQHQLTEDVKNHHYLLDRGIRNYLAWRNASNRAEFVGRSKDELFDLLYESLEELAKTSALSVLSAIEAWFKIDYHRRAEGKMKDDLSRALRSVYAAKGKRASFEDDILSAWADHTSGGGRLLSELRGALKYRHWLAHGRYWTPKLARSKYDISILFDLAEAIWENFPFEARGP